ncbi:hypothetical protein EVAR_91630_1 [Eumeta japonica]|uniref:PiggyBac transposable element-derived protein domain-containing protein n=1 Tax=Eumeta variegata TaxID=151549 RepID=A0A4C1UX80_EUMVA|nr:hypothetical protein EVAR_91630_1 [Eumeta japonica]
MNNDTDSGSSSGGEGGGGSVAVAVAVAISNANDNDDDGNDDGDDEGDNDHNSDNNRDNDSSNGNGNANVNGNVNAYANGNANGNDNSNCNGNDNGCDNGNDDGNDNGKGARDRAISSGTAHPFKEVIRSRPPYYLPFDAIMTDTKLIVSDEANTTGLLMFERFKNVPGSPLACFRMEFSGNICLRVNYVEINSSFAITVVSNFASYVVICISVVTSTIQTPQISQIVKKCLVTLVSTVNETTVFSVVREEFLRYDAFIDIFDDNIMKEIVIESKRYAHQVLDKVKAAGIYTIYRWKDSIVDVELVYFRNLMSYDRCILLNKCLHVSSNDKQPLPNAKNKQPLAPSKQPFADSEQLSADNQEESAGSFFHRLFKLQSLFLIGIENSRRCKKKMKKKCKKGKIIARHSGGVMVLAWKNAKNEFMISTFHDNITYMGKRGGQESEKSIYVRDYKSNMEGTDLKDQKLFKSTQWKKREV